MLETLDRTGFLERMMRSADGGPMTVASVDIDRFGSINETFGRDAGDGVIAHVADSLFDAVVGHGFVARTGGDAFAACLPAVGPEWALLLLDVARRRVSIEPLVVSGHKIGLTISIGIASFPQHVEDASALLEAADQALHRAKTEGRDQVAIWVEEKMILKSNYYPRAQLAKLSKLAAVQHRAEAAVLREALDGYLDQHLDQL